MIYMERPNEGLTKLQENLPVPTSVSMEQPAYMVEPASDKSSERQGKISPVFSEIILNSEDADRDEAEPDKTPDAGDLRYVGQSKASYNDDYARIAAERQTKSLVSGHDDLLIKSARLQARMKNGAPPTILEIGSGSALLLDKMAGIVGADNVIGIDINPTAVELARNKGYRAYQAEAHNLPLADSSVDIIMLDHTAEHLPRISRFYQEAAKVLKPGGEMHVIVPPNLGGLETIRVAMQTMPDDYKTGNRLVDAIPVLRAWSYAKELHCNPYGGIFGGAEKQTAQILFDHKIPLLVHGGRKETGQLSSLLVFRKPVSQ